MDTLFRGRDGDYFLRSHVRIRSSFTRRRVDGEWSQAALSRDTLSIAPAKVNPTNNLNPSASATAVLPFFEHLPSRSRASVHFLLTLHALSLCKLLNLLLYHLFFILDEAFPSNRRAWLSEYESRYARSGEKKKLLECINRQ